MQRNFSGGKHLLRRWGSLSDFLWPIRYRRIVAIASSQRPVAGTSQAARQDAKDSDRPVLEASPHTPNSGNLHPRPCQIAILLQA
jgi:hypothetical protein